MRTLLYATLLTALGAASTCAQTSAHPRDVHPRDKEIHDADTLAWWHTTEALSNDAMEGRDTGTEAYQRAAEMVAARFKAAGLQPAGENGSYFQNVPMHQVDVVPNKTYFTLSIGESGELGTGFKFLEEMTVAPPTAPVVDVTAPIVFRGYCGKDAVRDVKGKQFPLSSAQRRVLYPNDGRFQA